MTKRPDPETTPAPAPADPSAPGQESTAKEPQQTPMSTHDYSVDITVKTRYLDDQSDPENKRYVFSYQVTITNLNPEPVQLLSRHWYITDGDQQVQEVQGRGVIGEQPVIDPQQSYSYTSGTVLPTEVGSMRGEYRMRADCGDLFDAPIPTFTLSVPNALH